METPLSPLEFARRTRRLHGDREAVVDGDLRLTYRQLFDRCDRWSSALQGLGVAQGDRVATISPNTHAQLESFYAVPQLEGEFGWEVTQVYGLTETAPFITVCAPLPEHEDMPPADRGRAQPRAQ